jgi:hypothetical protein
MRIRIKKSTLRPMVIEKRVLSMPLLAVNTLPLSTPVKPPSPTPLFCKITLIIKAIEVIIVAI